MATKNAQEFAQFCKAQGRGTLRAVFTYTEDGGEVLYARDDFRTAHRDGFERLRDAAWNVHTTVLAEEPAIETPGRYRSTVHTFDHSFVIQFRTNADEGIAVIFDREVGQNLHEFLLESEDHL